MLIQFCLGGKLRHLLAEKPKSHTRDVLAYKFPLLSASCCEKLILGLAFGETSPNVVGPGSHFDLRAKRWVAEWPQNSKIIPLGMGHLYRNAREPASAGGSF